MTATVSNPTLESDGARFGVPVSRQNYPNGLAGVHLSLAEMCRRIEDARSSFAMQQFGEMVVRNWARVPVSTVLTHKQCAQIFLDFVRAQVRYRPDPPGTEMTKSAAILLCVQGAQICIPVGDCDDLTVAFDGLCAAYGIPVKILKQIFGESDQEHVLGLIEDDDGTWYPADPSAGSDKPVGWKAPATREDIIDPLDPATIRRVGANEAEFIGVGAFSQQRGRRRLAAPKSITGLVRAGLGAGTRFVWPSDVRDAKIRIDAKMKSVANDMAGCAALSPSDKASWMLFFAAWRAFYCDDMAGTCTQPDVEWFGSGGALDTCDQWEISLFQWQNRLAAVCRLSAPISKPPTPIGDQQDAVAEWLKGATGLVVAGTVAYVAVSALGWLDVFRPAKRAR